MAWYYGTYSCKHEGRVNVVGPQKDRQWKIDRRFEGVCPECYKKKQEEEREKENKKAAEKSIEMELPELSGSEKQVAWANTLRLKVIEKYRDYTGEENKFFIYDKIGKRIWTTKEELSDSLDYSIQKHTDAKFWIENKFYSDSEILADFILEYRDFSDKNDIPDDVKKEIEEEKEQLTVIPETEVLKSGVVEIEYRNNILFAKYIKDEDFIKIVKSLNYKWNGVWSKEITEYTGADNDRAAELGNKLLIFGFTVKFPNEESKEKAISASFELENDRWIKYNPELEKLSIVWNGRNNTLYESAKKLPSAKWENGCMRVKIEFYKEVEDFADTMGFSISNTARKNIDEYKEKESAYEKANVSVKIRDVLSDEERIEKSLKSNGTIIKDLIDE